MRIKTQGQIDGSYLTCKNYDNKYNMNNLPSIQDNNWETILLSISLEAVSLFGVMESISSINKIHGAAAWRNI